MFILDVGGKADNTPLCGDLCARVFPAAEGTFVNRQPCSRRYHRHFNRYHGIVGMKVVVPKRPLRFAVLLLCVISVVVIARRSESRKTRTTDNQEEVSYLLHFLKACHDVLVRYAFSPFGTI